MSTAGNSDVESHTMAGVGWMDLPGSFDSDRLRFQILSDFGERTGRS